MNEAKRFSRNKTHSIYNTQSNINYNTNANIWFLIGQKCVL